MSKLLCMKGGILMALHYESRRFTSDIDFSTPAAFTVEIEEEVVSLLSGSIEAASYQFEYELDCRLQSYRIMPGRDKTYVTIYMSIGYASRGSREHDRLMRKQSTSIVSIDYSFMESIPHIEEVSVDGDGVLRVYALPTLMAEKFRALLQQPLRKRNRRQDIFDIHHLLVERAELQSDTCKSAVLKALYEKCHDRDVPVDINSIDQKEVHDMAAQDYQTLATEVSGDLPDFERAFTAVRDYYVDLPW
ncbi:nucleotidyl transferase AbiEii/AbiGii toxin family protein [Lysobacter capsici]|uniref:nucleotidyl transferase AbiEii/AbiGii toxin family protein n=1 Tax=Lysobacter capsici TaxID=435897 RepID=UPI00398D1831